MQKIKICIQMPAHWSWTIGGAEYQVSLIMQRLVNDDRFDVVFLTHSADASYIPDGYQIKVFAINRYLNGHCSAFDAQSLWASLHEIKPDIIYQRVGCSHTGICARYAQQHKIPLVWHISHDMDVDPKILPKKHIFGIIEKKILEYGIRHATKIIAQTTQQASLLKENYGRDVDLIIKNFHPTPGLIENKEDKLKIVWVANLKPMKQPEVFVRLVSELEEKINAQFIIIGQIQHKKYNNFLNDIKLIKQLTYLGKQPQSKVNEILSSAHLLVNTSKLEGFSNTFIQAWMRKVPVLTLSVDPDDVISQNNIGVCADGNYEKLRDAITDLANSPEKLRQMGERAKAYADEHHSMANVDRIIETLASCQSLTN